MDLLQIILNLTDSTIRTYIIYFDVPCTFFKKLIYGYKHINYHDIDYTQIKSKMNYMKNFTLYIIINELKIQPNFFNTMFNNSLSQYRFNILQVINYTKNNTIKKIPNQNIWSIIMLRPPTTEIRKEKRKIFNNVIK